jgi:hypothetical protein
VATAITNDINFYPVFSAAIQVYTIKYHINDELVEVEAQFNTPLIDTLPKKIPFSSNNTLVNATNRLVYPFLGYSENSAEAIDNLIDFNNTVVTNNREFYAVFGASLVDVTDSSNVFYPAWDIVENT